MKSDIHPAYFPNATISCAGCGTSYTIGSTKEAIQVELCSNCHPFYTGKQKLVDTGGRVERFKRRQAQARGGKQAAPEPAAEEAAPVAEGAPTTEDRLAQMKESLEDEQ